MKLEEKIFEMLHTTVEENGYILHTVSYEKEGNLYFLRIEIDSIQGVTVEDCVTVSKLINPILDKENPIEESYILDVCSKEKGCD